MPEEIAGEYKGATGTANRNGQQGYSKIQERFLALMLLNKYQWWKVVMSSLPLFLFGMLDCRNVFCVV